MTTKPQDTAPTETLLPCPFCGGGGPCAEDDGGDEGDDYFFVQCTCTATGPSRLSEAEAVAAWNTRHD